MNPSKKWAPTLTLSLLATQLAYAGPPLTIATSSNSDSSMATPTTAPTAPIPSSSRKPAFFSAPIADTKSPEAHEEIPLGFNFIKTPSAYITLFGGGFKYFESETFGIGGVVYTGQISNGATGTYTLAGIEPSVVLFPYSPIKVEISLLMGAAGGTQTSGATISASGGLILDPKVSFVFAVGKEVRGAVNLSYNWDTNNTAFAGVMFGLGIHFVHY